jgi:hypothetical protein
MFRITQACASSFFGVPTGNISFPREGPSIWCAPMMIASNIVKALANAAHRAELGSVARCEAIILFLYDSERLFTH